MRLLRVWSRRTSKDEKQLKFAYIAIGGFL